MAVIMKSGLPSHNTTHFKEKPMFQRNILPPSSGSESKPSKEPSLLLLVSSLALSLTLNIKVICSSKLAGCLNYKDHTFHKTN
jgi:hypothetical protein